MPRCLSPIPRFWKLQAWFGPQADLIGLKTLRQGKSDRGRVVVDRLPLGKTYQFYHSETISLFVVHHPILTVSSTPVLSVPGARFVFLVLARQYPTRRGNGAVTKTATGGTSGLVLRVICRCHRSGNEWAQLIPTLCVFKKFNVLGGWQLF